MRIYCECGREIIKKDKFNLKESELDKFVVCEWCGRKWHMLISANPYDRLNTL